MGNQALTINGFTNTVTTDNHITTHGSDWYFAVSAVMTVSSLVIMGLSFNKKRPQRLFHYLTAALTLVSAIAYFCMGSNLGWTAIHVEFERDSSKVRGDMRQIFYVRYIDYFVAFPLLLADILLTCGLPNPTILYVILMNEIYVIMALVGSLVKSTYKWGFFAFGTAALLFVAYTVVWEGRAYARALGADILRTYTIISCWSVLVWICYPVAWGVSEGGNVIAPDSEAVFYGVLDVLSKPVFAALLFWGLWNVDIERLGIHIRDAATEPGTISEKAPATNSAGEAPIVAPAAPETV